MPVTLATHAVEESTFIVQFSFTDHAGAAITPKAGAVYSLTDRDGNIINSREDVGITEGTTMTIAISGDDLALSDPADNLRIITIEATYDGVLGNDLPLRDSIRFYIDNLLKIS